MFLYVCGEVHVSVGVTEARRKLSTVLGLQEVVSQLMLVLGPTCDIFVV
jgi:hypothetical protein